MFFSKTGVSRSLTRWLSADTPNLGTSADTSSLLWLGRSSWLACGSCDTSSVVSSGVGTTLTRSGMLTDAIGLVVGAGGSASVDFSSSLPPGGWPLKCDGYCRFCLAGCHHTTNARLHFIVYKTLSTTEFTLNRKLAASENTCALFCVGSE